MSAKHTRLLPRTHRRDVNGLSSVNPVLVKGTCSQTVSPINTQLYMIRNKYEVKMARRMKAEVK